MKERWRPVVGYQGYYEVSDRGRVRSVPRIVSFEDGRVRSYQGVLLKLKPHNQYGYPLAALCRGRADKRWRTVHQLVMEAFVGPRPQGQEVCHNANNLSASLSNLRYDTRSNNARDQWRHGTMQHGATHPSAKFSDALLERVRRAKGTVSAIAERFRMSRTHVWNVRNSKRRGHGSNGRH